MVVIAQKPNVRIEVLQEFNACVVVLLHRVGLICRTCTTSPRPEINRVTQVDSLLWFEVVAEGKKSLSRFEVNHVAMRVPDNYK
tara:strand:+ start:453 stop:704 length:252 start_codon:yes stop_codon:yes gene_type:complete